MMLRLEMTSPTQLIPGAPPPTPLTLEEVRADSAPLIRTLYNRIWDPIGPSGRSAWTDASGPPNSPSQESTPGWPW